MNKELEAFRIMVKDNDLELPYHNTIIAIETALIGLSNIIILCKEYGIDFIGTEIEKEYCEIAQERLVKLV